MVAGALIGVNWFLFVFAVDTGFVVQISLGYFITPLVNVLLGPAGAYLMWLHVAGTGAFLRVGPISDGLLAGGGLVTVVPLLLFASAVRRVPLTLIGILQYIAPTMHLLLGVFVFGEPFAPTQLVGFAAL